MKRAFLVAAAAILVTAPGICWIGQQRAAARRLAQWEAEQASEAHPPVLSKMFDWDRANLTLSQFSRLVTAKTGLPVEIDTEGIASDAAVRYRWPSTKAHDIGVTVPRGEFSPVDVLRVVLTPATLEADVRGGRLVITTWANSDSRRERTVVYPVPHPKPAGLRESDWEQLIQANIDGHAHQGPGAIIVVASRADHERAQLVIESISALREPAPQAIAIPVPFSDAELKIRAELEHETSVDFVEQPLKDVVIYLSERHKIPLILAADKLEEASVSVHTPITKTLRGISLRSALSLVLKDLQLAYTVRDQALVITTPEDADRDRTVAYQVRDLAEVQTGFPGIGSLGELIRATIAPYSWSNATGAGPWYAGDDWLVIDQTDRIHEQVAALLAMLRQMLTIGGHGPSQPIEPMRDMERRIRAALERPIALDFNSVPLKDAVLYLGESLKIPILLSSKKLEEAGLSPDLPVTFKTSPIPARVALERLLKAAELDYVIRDEVLQITTPEDVESHLTTRIYDTRTILQRMSGQQLRDFVRDNVQPDSWNYRGGGADIIRGLLVVSHTDRRHEEVERLVEKLTAEAAEAK